ncbi:MAG TPA: TIM barrel protein [Chitinophagaceae bacterium]|nr:TIM barrel protein [Chitinophagaceae bacterium]
MNNINRRAFLSKTAIGAGALALSQVPGMLHAARAVNMPVGFQTFPVRDKMGKDLAGTLKGMADLGYTYCEMCYPVDYASIGYGFMKDMKPAEIKKVIEDSGLKCISSHFGKASLTADKVDTAIEWAHTMGLTQMICSTFWLPKNATLKDYYDDCDRLNKGAEKIKAAGMQAGFHNHDMEFHELEGKLIYDELMAHLDPDLVKMQFQTQVVTLGYKAADYFKKYPGRFISSHLSDWTADKKEVPIGSGVIDWKEFFKAAKKGGVKNIFVEEEANPENMKNSVTYIKSL